MKTLRLLHYKPNILPLPVYAHFHGHLIAPAIHHQMISTLKSSLPHIERTVAEPRQNKLYNVRLSHIEQINPTVRLLRLAIPPNESEGDKSREDEESTQEQPFTFLPGQWLDVHIPSVSEAGGFSITSTPADARVLPPPESPTDDALGIEEPVIADVETQGRPPYVELAVQEAPSSPAAAWLWKPQDEILGKKLSIRVGGSFVWPPDRIDTRQIKTVALIAGGMGINPLISILSHLNNNDPSLPGPPTNTRINILYTTRLPKGTSGSTAPGTILDQILFLPRVRQIMGAQSHSRRLRISLDLFITDLPEHSELLAAPPTDLAIHPRRIKRQDLQTAVTGGNGGVNPASSVCYLCGPPAMTDEFIEVLRGLLGGETERVLFERWW